MTSPARLTLTARLNTSAVDSRRGVIRLHPNAIAALGIREWDAVSLTGARTTTAVAGMAGPQTPIGTVLLDDVTLSIVEAEHFDARKALQRPGEAGGGILSAGEQHQRGFGWR